MQITDMPVDRLIPNILEALDRKNRAAEQTQSLSLAPFEHEFWQNDFPFVAAKQMMIGLVAVLRAPPQDRRDLTAERGDIHHTLMNEIDLPLDIARRQLGELADRRAVGDHPEDFAVRMAALLPPDPRSDRKRSQAGLAFSALFTLRRLAGFPIVVRMSGECLGLILTVLRARVPGETQGRIFSATADTPRRSRDCSSGSRIAGRHHRRMSFRLLSH